MLFTVTLMSFAVIIYATAGALGRSGRGGGGSMLDMYRDDERRSRRHRRRSRSASATSSPCAASTSRSQAGEFFSIIGPSGCGKTTTLRMIAGFEDPTAGTISVGGRDMTGVRPYRRPVNTVFQSYALFPHLDVFENVAFGLREAQVGKAEMRDAGRARPSSSSSSRAARTRGRASSPAASSSASRSRGRWSTAPRCCCSTSRWARST